MADKRSGVEYAPHRPTTSSGRAGRAVRRARERSAVYGYRAAAAAIARIPPRISLPAGKAVFVGSYYAWPYKRRIILSNASHVLGLPPSDKRVRHLARRVYATYARFIIELMRLPTLPADEPRRILRSGGEYGEESFVALFERLRAEKRGLIAVSAHIGSIDVLAGAFALRGLPTYGLADDSAYPELFEEMNANRRRWGIEVIPWRNMRRVFHALRQPAILGLVVDWGYRPDGIPVRLFGEWTTLPAGPALLAARTGAAIVPVVCRRREDGTYDARHYDAIEVADDSEEQIAARHPAHRRRCRGHDRDGARAVVFVQADLARVGGRKARAGRARQRRPGACVTSAAAARAGADSAALRGSLKVRLLTALSAVLVRLPERPLHRVADLLGGVLSRLQPARRRLVRSNLEHVVTYLAEREMGGPRVAAAARDGRALDHMVRAAFGHWVRSYLEVATLSRHATDEGVARVRADEPWAADAAFPKGSSGPAIVVSMHFGAIEIPALWLTRRGVPMTAPMETVDDPALQDYMERTRGKTGINVIPLKGAAAELRGALARNETIALVADRPIGGSGTRVELFGASARLPLGPAVLALETGAPAWLCATRRVGRGDYRTRIERIDLPEAGSVKDRLRGFLDNEARAFERAVADAPEQWWTIFFPIWEEPATTRGAS